MEENRQSRGLGGAASGGAEMTTGAGKVGGPESWESGNWKMTEEGPRGYSGGWDRGGAGDWGPQSEGSRMRGRGRGTGGAGVGGTARIKVL